MIKYIKTLFAIEKKPAKGLLTVEWCVLAYMTLTLLIVLFTYTKLANPEAMIWGRVRIGATTMALWAVYRLVPCRITRAARIITQLALLAWWYPDTYEINRMFSNLDHLFAAAEQSVMGFQPALTFAADFPSPIISELMSLGYTSYYPMIFVVVMFFFFCRYKEFERCSVIILLAFFIYYVFFIFVPVAGPTFYYKAVGIENITRGVFPAIHDYFNTHQDCLPTPGYTDGFFYGLVEDAKAAGERPTAAFPSSHVGVATVCVLLAWHSRNRRLLFTLIPFYILLCLSTVYIQAHYAIDAYAGLISGAVIYFTLLAATRKMKC